LTKGFDDELSGILKDIDLSVDHPLSSLPAEKREMIWKELKRYRDNVMSEKYNLGYNGSVGSPISNMLNNIERQAEYFRYFVKNFGRLRCNDLSVETERFNVPGNDTYDFNHFSVHFFDGRQKLSDGVSVFVDRDNGSRIMLVVPDKGPLYADELTDECACDILCGIRDGINAAIDDLNDKLEKCGFLENCHFYPVFLDMAAPVVHDYEGSPFPDRYLPNPKFSTGYMAARQNNFARRSGMDGVIYRNVTDPFRADSYGVFSAERIHMISPSLMRREDMDLRMKKVDMPVAVESVLGRNMRREGRKGRNVRNVSL